MSGSLLDAELLSKSIYKYYKTFHNFQNAVYTNKFENGVCILTDALVCFGLLETAIMVKYRVR